MLAKITRSANRVYAGLHGFDFEGVLDYRSRLHAACDDFSGYELERSLWETLIKLIFLTSYRDRENSDRFVKTLCQMIYKSNRITVEDLTQLADVAPEVIGFVCNYMNRNVGDLRKWAVEGRLSRKAFLWSMIEGCPDVPERILAFSDWVWELDMEAWKTS